VGRLLTLRMARANAPLNAWTLTLLDLRPTDRVLELGCGPGHALRRASELAPQGFVAGIDHAPAMVRQAQARNAAGIRTGRVEVRLGDASHVLPYDDNAFDVAYAVQVLYFLPDPLPVLRELRRVLRPGGVLAMTVRAAETLAQSRFAQTGVYTLWREPEIEASFREAGFEDVRFERAPFKRGPAFCVLGEVPRSTQHQGASNAPPNGPPLRGPLPDPGPRLS
jgi:SAM-dependent methyltransferase